ncbi:MAG TPA: hypothetical protein VHM70_13485 [Polyangiaceae bacterium]|jgi:hypothetical protein|nr:hypothetical protein [Polyangiaceae bacterium]
MTPRRYVQTFTVIALLWTSVIIPLVVAQRSHSSGAQSSTEQSSGVAQR